MKKKTLCRLLAAAVSLALLAGCSSRETKTAEAAPTAAAQAVTPTPVPTATPTPVPTATPTPAPTATPTPAPTPTPTPTPTATPTPTPTPVPDPPFVTKHPSNTTVQEGGSCQFEAGYINAVWAVWHFVSPDGQTDITYEEINQRFPTLTVGNGMYSTMQLSTIPIGMNGWKVYCRYTNGGGSTNTNSAILTVTAAPVTPSIPTAQEFLGSYQDKVSQRASMDIGGTPDILRVSIRWGSSAWESTTWFFTGRFDERGVLEYSGCIRTDIVFDSEGKETDTTVYDNGAGKLEYLSDSEGSYLRWTDYTQGADRGAKFVKLPG